MQQPVVLKPTSELEGSTPSIAYRSGVCRAKLGEHNEGKLNARGASGMITGMVGGSDAGHFE